MFSKLLAWIKSIFSANEFISETFVMTTGNLLAKSHPELVEEMTTVYRLFKVGKLTEPIVNRTIFKLRKKNISPLLLDRLNKICEILGIEIVEGFVENLDGLKSEEAEKIYQWLLAGAKLK